MKKFWGIIIYILFVSTGYSQKMEKNNRAVTAFDVDSLHKNYLTTYTYRPSGRFTIKTKYMEDLLFSGTYGSYGWFTSHAVIKIDNSVYTQNPDISTATFLDKPDYPSQGQYQPDTNRIIYTWSGNSGSRNGVDITQELIPRENIQKKAGAVLIKYTFSNKSPYTKRVGMMLKLDTKIGGVGYGGINDPNDKAPIASLAGLIDKQSYIKPVPDFWLAFQDPRDTNAMIGRGTLRGKDLVLPDTVFIGDYNQLVDFTYGKTLISGDTYGDSEILLIWNEVEIPPGGTKYFSTLYGMGEIDYQGDNFRLYCKAPFDTLSLDPQSDYEVNPFDYLITIANPGLTLNNVKAIISFSKRNIFYLESGSKPDSIYNIGPLNGGEQKVAKWRIRASNQLYNQWDTLSVKVTNGDISDSCYTPIYVPANRARLRTFVNWPNKGSATPSETLGSINSKVQITATVTDNCYEFDKWTGDFTGTKNPDSVLLNISKDVTAVFRLKKYTLTTNSSPSGSGTITRFADSTGYSCGSTVTLTPIPISGFRFIGWSGNASGNTIPLPVVMNIDKNIIANFEPDSFTLVININPPTAGKAIPPGGKFKNGDVIPITASATDYCYKFKNWTGDTSASDTTINVKMWKNKTLTANFELKKFKLSIQPFQNGKVTITPTPTADSSYTCGTPVRITAVADKCYGFERWSTNYGDFIVNDTTMQIYADITGKPIFTINKVKLITSVYPVGSGRVNSKPSDTITYNCGDIASLVANPEPCYNFSKWNDGDTNIRKTITIENDRSIRAEFIKKRFSLSANVDFNGSGTITKIPDSAKYDCGSTVNVTLTPASCFSFVKWTGGASGSSKSISVYLDTNKSVLANMAQITFKLNSVTNNFPYIEPNIQLDSTLYDLSTAKTTISRANITQISDIGCTSINMGSNSALIPQHDGTYKIVYALTGCYNQACDTLRQTKISFSRDNPKCSDTKSLNYNIALNSGCDSCSRLLRRKDTTGHLMMKLFPNHPNPFNPETRIRYSISQTERVSLKIYDILGRAVSILVDEMQEPGEYEAIFVPRELPSGVYFYHLSAGTFNDLKKMLYVK